MRLTLAIRSSTIARVRRGGEQERQRCSSAGAHWVAALAAGGVAVACAPPPTGSVTGLAWACAGAAITADQMVSVQAYSGSELVASVMTSGRHAYTMHLPPGAYSIRVAANAPGGVVEANEVTVTANRAVDADFPDSCR